MPSVVTDARIIFIFVHCNNTPSWYWNLQFVHISWLRSHAFQFYWEMHSFDILFTIKQNRITIEVNSNIYISLGYSMHSHTETERSIFMKMILEKVQWNVMQHLHVHPFYTEKVFKIFIILFFYRFLICKRRVSLFFPLEMKIPIFLRSQV